MSVTIEIKGREAIVRDLTRFPEKAVAVYGQAVQRASERLRDTTKTLPPVSAKRTGYDAKGIPVDTGRMRQAIQKRKISLLAAGVTARVDYGSFVHDGTGRMPARPFFDWALEAGAQADIDTIFEDAASSLP